MPAHKVEPTEKACEWCGGPFLVGGRGRPRLDARFCSKRCTSFARVRQPKVRAMSSTQAAYLAGLIDGEGSIVVMRRLPGGRATYRVNVCSTTEAAVQWCLASVGTGTIVRSKRQAKAHHLPTLYWQCYSWNAIEVLRQCEPYMVIKRDKALSAIAELASISSRG